VGVGALPMANPPERIIENPTDEGGKKNRDDPFPLQYNGR